jgi:muramoyltetrapeptide carboxypeptidase
MIFPKFLKEGDTIGICPPSAGVGHKLDSFDASLNTLHEAGYYTKETASVRVDSIRPASGDQRAKELSELITDPNINAVFSASGGDFAPEMLPYVNWDEIRENPKWIAGASDPTNILYPITTKLDIATIYGFNAGSFDWNPLHLFQENMLQIIRGNLITQHSFDKYDDSHDFSDTTELDGNVYWESQVQGNDEHVHFSGRLIGGCIDCITKLMGTSYDGTNDFLNRYRKEGILWYFDPFDMTPETLYITMLQMKYAGYFEGTTGVIFGRVMFSHDAEDEQYMELLARCFDVPVVWNCDIGHVKPCMTLINGSIATVDVSDGFGTIEMRLE